MKSAIIILFMLFAVIIINGCNKNSSPTAPVTVPLGAPVLTSPPNNSTVTDTSIVFKWDSVANALTYNIEISTDSLFETVILGRGGISAKKYTVATGLLLSNSAYYWHVSASDTIQTGNFSAVWKVHTPVMSSITGNWQLTNIQGNIQNICINQTVMYPDDISGTAVIICPGIDTLYSPYTINNNILTFTTSGTVYTILTLTHSVLVLHGTSNTLTYSRISDFEKP